MSIEAPEVTEEKTEPQTTGELTPEEELARDTEKYDIEEEPADEIPAGDLDAAGGQETVGEEQPKGAEAEAKDTGPDVALLARAKALGFSDEQAQKFAQAGLLDETLTFADKRFAAIGREEPEEEPEGKAGVAAAVKSVEAPVISEIPDLNPDEYDEPLVKGFAAMKALAAQLAEYRTTVEKVVDTAASRERDTLVRWFDDQVTALPAEYTETFGKGPGIKLAEKGPEFTNRGKLLKGMAALAAGLDQTGQDLPPQEELFQRALRMEFGDLIVTNTRKAISAQLNKRAGQQIARPTHKIARDDTRTPRQRAIAAVKQVREEKGAGLDEEEPEI